MGRCLLGMAAGVPNDDVLSERWGGGVDDRPGMGGALATAAAMCAVSITNDQGDALWRRATWRGYALGTRRRGSEAVDLLEESHGTQTGRVYPSSSRRDQTGGVRVGRRTCQRAAREGAGRTCVSAIDGWSDSRSSVEQLMSTKTKHREPCAVECVPTAVLKSSGEGPRRVQS